MLTFALQALQSGELVKGGIVTEGSAGSTAISLATLAPAYGCKCHVVIPDDAAIEKVLILFQITGISCNCVLFIQGWIQIGFATEITGSNLEPRL